MTILSKYSIRQEILHARQSLGEDEQNYKSNLIYQSIINDEYFIKAPVLFVYLSTKNEVSTTALIKKAWELGKTVAAPKVNGNGMEFYVFSSFNQLKVGPYYGILEPTTTEPIQTKEALIIMPGVAFDYQRNRIGYGKGYYDRYISEHPYHETIALAFDCQLVKEIPSEEHDFKPNKIITETNIIK